MQPRLRWPSLCPAKPSSVASVHLSRTAVARSLMRPTRGSCGVGPTPVPEGTRPLLGLAPGGVLPAGMSPHRWWALAPPFHPCSPNGGRYVSVPLSVESPRLGITQRPVLWSSDFPPPLARERTLGPLQHYSSTSGDATSVLTEPCRVPLPPPGAARRRTCDLDLGRRPVQLERDDCVHGLTIRRRHVHLDSFVHLAHAHRSAR